MATEEVFWTHQMMRSTANMPGTREWRLFVVGMEEHHSCRPARPASRV